MKNNGLLFFITFLFFSCGSEQPKGSKPEVDAVEEKKLVSAPVFNQDSAYSYVEKQVSFGPRIPNTSAHYNCSDYLVRQLRLFGAEVIEQDFQPMTFDKKTLRAKNIIVSINPQSKKRVLLASHWDTRPWSDEDDKFPNKTFDGANDGGSGVGVLMEIVRSIQRSTQKPTIGVDIILFDAEDYGKSEFKDSYCLGSQYWSKNKHNKEYSAFYGILLDMVGGKNARFNKEGISMEYAPSVVNKVWDQAVALGYGNYFIHQTVNGITDDHYYVNKLGGIPMIDIIEYDSNNGFSPTWHTQEDNMNNIDKSTLKAVGQTVLQVIYNEN